MLIKVKYNNILIQLIQTEMEIFKYGNFMQFLMPKLTDLYVEVSALVVQLFSAVPLGDGLVEGVNGKIQEW